MACLHLQEVGMIPTTTICGRPPIPSTAASWPFVGLMAFWCHSGSTSHSLASGVDPCALLSVALTVVAVTVGNETRVRETAALHACQQALRGHNVRTLLLTHDTSEEVTTPSLAAP